MFVLKSHLDQFSTPSGLTLYGILMEYIEAPTVSKNSIQVLSKTEQLQLVRFRSMQESISLCADA